LAILAKYRIDELVPKQYRAKLISILLLVFKRKNCAELTRGEQLRLALEELGPIFIKFGQLLSTRPDLIPEDIIAELNKLQDQVPPFDEALVRQIIEEALNQPIDNLFDDYNEKPLASASIAQVHTAKLKSGQEVVIKVVRPDIETTIAKDVDLMSWFAKRLEHAIPDGKRLRPVEVVKEYKQTIFDELDLKKEAANASQLRRNFTPSNMLYVPEVHWDYCSTKVMVMERIYGAPVTDLDGLTKNNVDIKRLAEKGVEIFFTQVFDHNFFHADMHPGNVFVSLENPKDPKYIALEITARSPNYMCFQGGFPKKLQLALSRPPSEQYANLYLTGL